MKILVIDDHFPSRKFIEAVVGGFGVCHSAGDGKEGLALFCEALEQGPHYSLIFLDIQMPEQDGIEVLNAIREIESERDVQSEDRVMVIMTTVNEDSMSIYDAHMNGCTDYIVKPFTKDKILGVLEKQGLLDRVVQ